MPAAQGRAGGYWHRRTPIKSLYDTKKMMLLLLLSLIHRILKTYLLFVYNYSIGLDVFSQVSIRIVAHAANRRSPVPPHIYTVYALPA